MTNTMAHSSAPTIPATAPLDRAWSAWRERTAGSSAGQPRRYKPHGQAIAEPRDPPTGGRVPLVGTGGRPARGRCCGPDPRVRLTARLTSRGRRFRRHHAAARADCGANRDHTGTTCRQRGFSTEALTRDPAIGEQRRRDCRAWRRSRRNGRTSHARRCLLEFGCNGRSRVGDRLLLLAGAANPGLGAVDQRRAWFAGRHRIDAVLRVSGSGRIRPERHGPGSHKPARWHTDRGCRGGHRPSPPAPAVRLGGGAACDVGCGRIRHPCSLCLHTPVSGRR